MTIRRIPEDFDVREMLSPDIARSFQPARAASTDHAVYQLTKTSLTTPDATAHLAKALGIKATSVHHAGLKDKHARTLQHVSIELPGDAPQDAQGHGWSASLIGWSSQAAEASWIDQNQFVIVVRDLSEHAAREIGSRTHALSLSRPPEAPRQLLIVNYFGDQRFGSARHGEGFVAKHLVRGEFEQALKLAIGTPARKDTGKRREFSRLLAGHWGDWKSVISRFPRCAERGAVEALAAGRGYRDAFAELPYFFQQMCVEAFQSYLWNAVARTLVTTTATTQNPAAMLQADDDFGLMQFPSPGVVYERWRSLDVPMPAPDAVYPPPVGDAMNRALAAEGLTLAGLKIPGLRRPVFGTAPRPLFVLASGMTLLPIEPDDLTPGKRVKRTVAFTLPRGSYATVVLRALGQ